MGLGLLVIAVQVLLVVVGSPGLPPLAGVVVTGSGVVLVTVCSLLVAVAPVADDVGPVALASPVRGRWAAVNSPGQRLPSHGTRARGQYCAVDVCGPDTPGTPPLVSWALRGSRPEEYACFGAPVHAMAGGRVVTAYDGRRDHRSRNTWPLLAFMLVVEGLAREIAGTRAILGNHVVVDHGDGTYAAYAHLRRGSVAVRAGDEVAVGDVLGHLGNTGNTSMPHLHVQLMDRANPDAAAGIAMTWHDAVPTGELDPALARWAKDPHPSALPGMPRNAELFETTP